jgi:hypothetical protein
MEQETLGVSDRLERAVGKNLLEGLRLTGEFEVVHRRGGEVIDRRVIKNLVVNAGKAAAAGLLNGVITNFFEHIAIGTGAVAPAAGDTALGAEITTGGGARAPGTASRVTTTVANDTAQIVLTFNFTASFAVTESGVFDSISAGTMLCRQTFAAVNVVNGDSLQVTWKIQVS